MGGNATYGFILFYDLLHAVSAKQCMDGQTVKGNCIRVGRNKNILNTCTHLHMCIVLQSGR